MVESNMNLKELRQVKGMSQSELATAANLSVRTIQRLEQGHKASLKTVRTLSGSLDLPVDQLHQYIDVVTQAVASTDRVHFLDNLRSFLVFLVVVYHCGIVYESSGIGAYFWLVDDLATNDLSGVFNLVIDMFVMAGLFFIAGFFAPASIQSRSYGEYTRGKAKRLLLPWLFAVLTLIPIYKVVFLASRGLPQENWESYFHFSNGIISQSWLWFLPILFVFNLVYAVFHYIQTRLAPDQRWLSLPKCISGAVILSALSGMFFSFAGLNGWTKSWVLDFQNERILTYFMCFLIGAVCYQRQVFTQIQPHRKLVFWVNCTAWIPINLYLGVVIYQLLNPNGHLLAAWLDEGIKQVSFHISLLMMLYSLAMVFQRFFHVRSDFTEWINRNSYGTYVIHTIVLGVIALYLQTVSISSVAKYVILIVTTFVSCQGLLSLYRMFTTNFGRPRQASE